MDARAQTFDPARWLVASGQAWLDARLAASTAARRSLPSIDGRRFAIVLEGPDVRIGLRADGQRLILENADETGADARLIATPLDALKLARSQSLSNLKRTDARLEGNIHVAEAFAKTLALVAPDLEEELAGWVGDIAAHEIASVGRSVAAFLHRAHMTLEQNAAELFKEEQPALARPWEVDEFVEEVDEIRDAVERAASRLAALEQKLGRRRPPAVS